MKSIIAIAALLLSVSSFAATIKITSFNYVRTNQENYPSPLAELCGQVSGATSSPTFINVKVDPSNSNPASYNTFAGVDGKFCVAVITFRGRAEATVIGGSKSVKAQIQ